MTVHYYTASSLDGFLATPEHSLEWLLKQDFDSDGPMAYPTFMERIGTQVMGAATYEWLRGHGDGWDYATPTWVFTTRDLAALPGADVRFVRGEVAATYSEILDSAQGRDVWVMGGGDLAGQFLDAGLLDEIWIQFAPVTLGAGRPLLPRSAQLDLLDTARNRDFVCTHYRVR